MAHLLNRSRPHGLIVAVNKNEVDLKSLTLSRSQPLQHLTFLAQKHGEVFLFAGQHRIAATKTLLEKHLQEYKKIQSSRDGNQNNDDALWKKEKELYAELEYHGSWTASVYDLGGATVVNA